MINYFIIDYDSRSGIVKEILRSVITNFVRTIARTLLPILLIFQLFEVRA